MPGYMSIPRWRSWPYRGGAKPYSPRCVEWGFSEVELRNYGVLGSSLSSGAARRRLRVRHEAPEDGIADAPLKAP
jgi:hypothetical protein